MRILQSIVSLLPIPELDINYTLSRYTEIPTDLPDKYYILYEDDWECAALHIESDIILNGINNKSRLWDTVWHLVTDKIIPKYFSLKFWMQLMLCPILFWSMPLILIIWILKSVEDKL